MALAGRRPLWLVGAELCVFTTLDLHAVPERHRARAIAERARQLAPFDTPGWHAADAGGEVALWCWDASRVSEAMAADGAGTGCQVLPEALHFTPGEAEGLRRLDDGTVLLERWRAGRLVFCVPLPEAPAGRALRMRSAGLAVDATLPALDATLQAARWDLPPFDWRRALREPVAASLAALALSCLWLAWSLAELGGQRLANARLEAAVEARVAELAPVLADRERALALGARNQALAGVFGTTTALEAAAEFEYLVGNRYQRLLQWEFNARGIRAMLEDSAPDNRAYVEALQRSPWFERASVTPTLRPEQVSLEITLADDRSAAPLHAGGAR